MGTVIENPVTVVFEELEGSPREVGGEASFTATRWLKCAWGERLVLADELLRGFEIAVGANVLRIGQRYPHRDKVHAVSVEIEPFDARVRAWLGDASAASYDQAKLTVRYEPRNLGVALSGGESADVRIAEETLTTSVESTQAPGRRLYWSSNTPIEVDEAPVVLARLVEWTYALKAVAVLPTAWTAYAGHVNSAAVTSASLGVTFEAESLLYHGFEARRVITSEGTQAWDVTLRFTYRPSASGGGWNTFLRAGVAEPAALYTDAGASVRYRPYATAELAGVLGLG